jgi:hypothetical protein
MSVGSVSVAAVQMAGCVPDRYGVAEYYTHFDKGWEKGAGGGEGTSGERIWP